MNMVMSIEMIVFFQSILLGAVLGAFYDIFRIIRIAVPPSKIAIFFQDILFFIIVAISSFYFYLTFNQGIVRGYLLLGQLLGFIVYYCTIGTLVFKAAEWIIKLLKKIFRFLFKVISWPFVKIFSLIWMIFRPICVFIKNIAKKILKNLKKALLSRRVLLYNYFNNIRKNSRHSETSKKRKSKKWLKSEKRKKRGA